MCHSSRFFDSNRITIINFPALSIWLRPLKRTVVVIEEIKLAPSANALRIRQRQQRKAQNVQVLDSIPSPASSIAAAVGRSCFHLCVRPELGIALYVAQGSSAERARSFSLAVLFFALARSPMA